MEQDDLTASQGLKNGMIDDALISGARNAAQHAYAPYSGSLVGAALRTARGAIYVGCNVENAAYPLTLCAERAAIAAAVLAEGRDCRIVEIAIHAEDTQGKMLSAAPCGGCRQCIHEMGAGTLVHFATAEGTWQSLPIAALLPHAYRLHDRVGRN